MELIVLELQTEKGNREFICTLKDTGKYWMLSLNQGNKLIYAMNAPTIIECLYRCAVRVRKLGRLLAINDSPLAVMLQGYLNMIEEKEIIYLIQHRKAS